MFSSCRTVAAVCQLFLVLGTLVAFRPAQATTYTVNSTGDTVAVDGALTFREALQAAATNAVAGNAPAGQANAFDTINFAIGAVGSAQSITVGSALPITVAASGPVVIDGRTQGGAGYTGPPLVELNGAGAGGGVSGLEFQNSFNCTVQGLVINRFPQHQIRLLNGGFNIIRGNYLGINALGTVGQGGTFNGVSIEDSFVNTIGGLNAGDRNVISGNGSPGIFITGTSGNGNNIQGNFIGTNAAGTGIVGNNLDGVLIVGGASSNAIGGTVPAARNIISGNGLTTSLNGVKIEGAASTGNTVRGNYIGTDVTGTVDLGNGAHGILVNGAPNTSIGGTAAGAGNLISGNSFSGVIIQGATATGNTVQGNLVGTNAAGTGALGNSFAGVGIQGGASNNTIGGSTPAARNIIAANGTGGVFFGDAATNNNVARGNFIGTNITGTAALGNTTGVFIASAFNNIIGGATTGARNLISGNTNNGVLISGFNGSGSGNTLQGNFIGTNAAGTAALPNTMSGVYVQGVPNTTIGGTTSGARNVISGNGQRGIVIQFASATETVVQGNYIGTNFNGAAALGNGGNGILLFGGTSNNLIGGTTAGARNVISGNVDGIWIDTDASSNTVQGNYIGTNAAGTVAIGNTDNAGVFVLGPNNLIGGTAPGARNLISGNTGHGIQIFNPAATDNTVQGNYIGTNAAGTASVGNLLDGVRIQEAANNLVGGTDANARNLISGNITNSSNGILIIGAGATNNTVQGNLIGTAANGTSDLGNGRGGVSITLGASNNLIGGFPDAGNVIAFNEIGVVLTEAASGTTIGNAILSNSIFSNDNLGIDLNFDGVTVNDAGDADNGTNHRQNFPVLNRVITSGSTTTVAGTLNSTANTTFIIEFFGVPNPDTNVFGTGFGEGDRYLDTRTVTTNASGNANFAFVLPSTVATGEFVTATATNAATNDTSEFSQAVVASQGASFVVNTSGDQADANIGDGVCDVDLATPSSQCTLRAALQEANALPDADVINFNIPGAGVHTIQPASALPVITYPVVINGFSQPGSSPNSLPIGGNAAILIELDGTNAGPFTDGLRITAGNSTVRGLVINRFDGDGIEFNTVGNNVLEGCYIGTDATGTLDRGNARTGVYINAVTNNTVGGTNPSQRVVVSGNNIHGVDFAATGGSNQLLGSYIGTNAMGNAIVGNSGQGITIQTPNNIVGGAAPGARNVISGNGLSGVRLTTAQATNNIIEGNYIGTDATGNADLGNVSFGVIAENGASSNRIGGTTSGAGNVVSGNNNLGIFIFTANNVLQGNLVGTNATGTGSIANGGAGVVFEGIAATGNLLGGTSSSARNVLSGNGGAGVNFNGDASGNTVSGNFIGVAIDGSSPLGNGQRGVLFFNGNASNNLVGGTSASAGNIIAYNGIEGVSAVSATGTGNAILSNSIFSNGGNSTTAPGIDFEPNGPNPNDPDDADTGFNTLQNYPTLTSALSSGGNTIVQGTLDSTPSTSFRVQFFSSLEADPSGNGEGQTLLDTRTVNTDASGDATFNFTLSGAVPFGQFITATATDNGNNTSEFFNALAVTAAGTLQFDTSTYTVAEDAGTATITVTRSNGVAGAVTVPVVVTPGSATRGSDYNVPSSGQPAGATVTNGTPAGGDTVTLAFGAGETSHSFNIAIINDSVTETLEAVNLALGTPTGGAVAGATNTATLTISDNDAVPVLDLNGGESGTDYAANFTEKGGPVPIVNAAALTVSDADSPNLASAKITLTNRPDGNDEILAATPSGAITAGDIVYANGTLSIVANAPLSDYQTVLRSLTYDDLSANPSLTPRRITLVVNDGTSFSNTAIATVNVTAGNDAPVAANQSVGTAEDTAKDIVLTATDAERDALTFSIVSGPSNGTLSGVAPNLTYTPNANFNGNDSFTFKANDGSADSNVATVTIVVGSDNDAPVAAAQTVTTNEDTAKTIVLSATDTENDALTFSVVTPPQNGALSGTAPNLTYTPNLNFNGADAFTFKANDGSVDSNVANVTLQVLAVNDAPIAASQSVTTNEDLAVSIGLSATDVDKDALTFSIVTQPTQGTLSGIAPNVTYTPNPNFNGSDTFTFKANDGSADSNIATVTIVVGSDNDAPVAAAQTVTTNEDTAKTIVLSATDTENDALTFSVVTPPQNGALSGTAPNLTYTPNLNFNGADAFTFKANDGSVDSNVATVTLQVLAVNDAPIAANQSVTTNENLAVSIGLSATDIDKDALTFSIVTQPTHGTLSGAAPNLTYTPDTNFNGSDSFTFKANDGSADSNVATVAIAVRAVNSVPVAQSQNLTTNEDTAKAIMLSASDNDSDALTFSIVSGPSNGTLSGVAPNLTYTPNANFNGSDTFTFNASDGQSASQTATITVQVLAVNDEPVAMSQQLRVDNTKPQRIALAASDIDGDALTYFVGVNRPGDSSEEGKGFGPIYGTLSGTAPNLIYTAPAGYRGRDVFTFFVGDGKTFSAQAKVEILVEGNAGVSAGDDSYTLILGPEGQTQQAGVTLMTTGVFRIEAPGVLANDRDPSGGTLQVRVKNSAQHGRMQLHSDGSFDYLPSEGFAGTDEFTYRVSNGTTTDEARVRVIVSDKRAPELRFDVPKNGAVVANVTEIAGRVRDKNSGLKSLTLLWRRADGKFWNGSSWGSSALELPLSVQGINWRYAGELPQPGGDPLTDLIDAGYDLRVTATDNSGNITHITNSITVANNTAAPATSQVRLSSAGASASQGAIVLRFTGALNENSARNATNFAVLLNGEAVEVDNAIYSENTVTLSGFDFAAGDGIELQISGLRDAEGQALRGGTLQLIAR